MTERARALLGDIPELKQVFAQVGSVPDVGDPSKSGNSDPRKAVLTLDWGDKGDRDRSQKTLEAVVRETRDPMRHLAVSNSVGAYIARRSGAPMAAELLDRVALFGRWQHHTVGIDYISGIEPPPGVTSADLYEQLCLHIVARAPDLADQAARDLIGFSQGHFTAALQDYFDQHAARLRGDGVARFGDNFRAPRRVLRPAAP